MSFLEHRAVVMGSITALFLSVLPGTSAAGRLEAELFDGPAACLDGAQACPAADYRTFMNTVAVVEFAGRGRTRLKLISTDRHAGGSTRLELHLDRETGVFRAQLLEVDPEGRETFRSTRANGLVELSPAGCRCAEGRLDLRFVDDAGAIGSDGTTRTLRLTRANFGVTDASSCWNPVQKQIQQLDGIAVTTLACPGSPAAPRRVSEPPPVERPYPYRQNDVVLDGGCEADYPPAEEQSGGCGGEDPPPDDRGSYSGDGCEGDPVEPDYDASGCEGDTSSTEGGCESDSSSDYSGGGCEGDSSSSGDCEGDAHAAVRATPDSRRQRQRRLPLRTLPVAWVGLALLRTAIRRRRRGAGQRNVST